MLCYAICFKEPVPLPDEETAERVHMNHHIAYLLDSALPLTIEPATSSVLTSMQQSNAQLIVRKLVRDGAFLKNLFGKLRRPETLQQLARCVA